MRPRAARLAALATGLLFMALAATAAGATASVSIMGFAFVPASIAINAGDTVTWTNKDAAAHSAVVSGVGQTPVLSQNQSGSLMFNTAGTFNYVCGIHGSAMMGTVIVRAAATPPPTVAPTPVPTPTVLQTAAPTIAPTVAPTITSAPTEQSTPSASPSPTASPAPTSAAPSATATPSIAAAVPTGQAQAPVAATDGGASPLLITLAAIALVAVVAFALARIRR